MSGAPTMRRRLMLSLVSLAAAVCVVYSGLAYLVAYMVEDEFFSSLLAVEATHIARSGDARPRLPFVERYDAWTDVPEEVRTGARSPDAREVPGRDGRHFHLRRVPTPTGDVWLVAEVSALLAVRPMRLTLLKILIPASAAIFVLSVVVAAAIARRGVRQLTALAEAVQSGSTRRLTTEDADREVRVVAQALETAFERIEGLLQRERAFVGDVSHELRTPLSVIHGAAELLVRNALDDTAHAQAARILEATGSSQEVIDLMLALAREEAAHEPPSAIHVLPFVEKMLLRHRSLLGREDVEVEVDIPSQMRIVAPTVATDVVLSNLIGNALRHGGGTPIFIGGRGRTISVRNGRRMDDQNRAQRPGIGLNLVRRLCVACGFDLSIETSESGTTAEISFQDEASVRQ